MKSKTKTQTPKAPEPHKTEKKKRRTKQTMLVLQRGKAMKERRKKMTNSIIKSVEKRNAYIKLVIFFCLSATSPDVFLLLCFGRLFFWDESSQPGLQMPDCLLSLSFVFVLCLSSLRAKTFLCFFIFLLSSLKRNESSNEAARCARLWYSEKISCDFKEQVIFSAERESWFKLTG